MRKTFTRLLAVSALTAASFGAQANTGKGLGLDSNAFETHRHSVYAKGGLLGAGLGYAYGIDERFTIRGDFTTVGKYSRSDSVGNVDYDLKLRNNVSTLSLDYFPFDSGFRLTAGVGLRNTEISGVSTTSEFRGVPIPKSNKLYAKVEWPTVAPYLGIGWGHNNGQKAKAGWGFIADAGVYIGRPSVSLHASKEAMTNLNLATGGRGQELIDEERREWEDKVKNLKVIPAVYVGVSYRF